MQKRRLFDVPSFLVPRNLERETQRVLHHARLCQFRVENAETCIIHESLSDQRAGGVESYGIGNVERLPGETDHLLLANVPNFGKASVHSEIAWAAEVVALTGF